MNNAQLMELAEKGQELNGRVDRLKVDIDAGRVGHLELVPEWAHSAIEDWSEGTRPSIGLPFIGHVHAAIRVFYSVERKSRQDAGWSQS